MAETVADLSLFGVGDHAGADLIAAAAALPNQALTAGLDQAFREKTAAEGRFLVLLGEVARREAFRDDGATSTESWAAERFGVSTPSARTYAHVAQKTWHLPHLVASMCAGEVSFDKVRVVADVATSETDRDLRDRARECTVRELADVARVSAERTGGRLNPPDSRSEHERRYLRCNDERRTITAQLPAESYAEAKSCIDARLEGVPNDGATPLDQRRCDGFIEMIHSSVPGGSDRARAASPYAVVAHVPLQALVGGSGETSELVGDLERGGLIDCATVRRIACDATISLAVDDDVGHTMYEGRATRFPTQAQRREVWRRDRHCRFPGCPNATFTNVHHIAPWKPDGTTDLPNLALVCRHHHGVVHREGWTMTGNANEELTFVSPNGRVMVSRPSPLWTRVAAGSRSGPASG